MNAPCRLLLPLALFSSAAVFAADDGPLTVNGCVLQPDSQCANADLRGADLDQLRAAVRAIMAESDAGGLAGIDQELEELTAAIIRVSPTDPRVGDDLRAISRRLAAAKERIERQFRP
mgnify:CR=1 FL=1